MKKNFKSLYASFRHILKGKIKPSSLIKNGWERNNHIFTYTLTKGSVLYNKFNKITLDVVSYDNKNNIHSSTLVLKHKNNMRSIRYTVKDWYELDLIFSQLKNLNVTRKSK